MDASKTELVKHESGEVAAHDAGHHPVPSYNPDAPSEEWGWHGQWSLFANRGSKILLGIFTLVMFAMLIGNHVSKVENYWLIGIGLLMVVWWVARERNARRVRNNARRRSVAQQGRTH